MNVQIMRGGGGKGWWLYTPTRATAYFGAGGWILLSPRWLWAQWKAERARRRRLATEGSRHAAD